MEPLMTLDEVLHVTSPMNRPAIPEENDGAAEMLEHASEEESDLLSGDIARVKVDEQSHALASRRNGNRGDGRNAVTLVAVSMDRRFARRRPRFSNIGDEQKSALIEKREMGPKFLRFFLSVAMSSSSSAQWRFRHAGWRDVPVFANSTPCLSAKGRHNRDGRRYPSGV